MASKVLFILGAGGNVGASVAKKFASEGYKVALASRSAAPGLSPEGYLNVRLDLTKSSDVAPAFEKVKEAFGAPSVVVYNASYMIANPDPLAIPADDFAHTLTTNITSAFVAAQQLVAGRSDESKVTYIYTGAKLNTPVFRWPLALTLGVGKAGGAHMIEVLAMVYTQKNALFYYADERTPTGEPTFRDINGDAHADFYWELAQKNQDAPGPVLATFVKGEGYKKFE